MEWDNGSTVSTDRPTPDDSPLRERMYSRGHQSTRTSVHYMYIHSLYNTTILPPTRRTGETWQSHLPELFAELPRLPLADSRQDHADRVDNPGRGQPTGEPLDVDVNRE
jgi:hypothetical protein